MALPHLTVGWYRDPSEPHLLRYWDGQRWSGPLPAPDDVDDHPIPPVEASAPVTKRRRGRRSVITVAEALVAALVLVAVVAFARSGSGPSHPVAVSQAAGRSTRTSVVVVPPTTTTVPAAPSIDTQVTGWWMFVGGPKTAALATDLGAIGQTGNGVGSLSSACAALGADTASAAAVPPPPAPSLVREWQLTVSTSGRAAAACDTGRTRALAGDLEPALLTINDLSAQVRPYLPH